LEHLEGSTKVLEKALQMGFKIAWFDMLKSLEDFKVMLDQVAMAGKSKVEQKNLWE
jgi:hypothetical protein